VLQPINDVAVLLPVDLTLMNLVKDDGFGLKKVKDSAPEECLRWRVIAAGPGNFSSNGVLCPNPLRVGDVVIFASITNRALKEGYAHATELIDGQKYILCRGFDLTHMTIIVERTSTSA
jgi:co-chaperonin GroES (HSP10)